MDARVDDPWALPNPVILLLVLAVALVAVPWLGGLGVVRLVRGPRRRSRTLGALAAIAAAATVAVYAVGALSMLQDETAATDACQRAVGPAHAADVSAYDTSFVPLRFSCRVDGVGSTDVFVPGFVNPTALVLGLITVLLVVLARRARAADSVPSTTGGTTP